MILLMKLVHPGLPNPEAQLDADAEKKLNALLGEVLRPGLGPLGAGEKPKISCWPGWTDSPTYLFILGDGSFVYVSEDLVETRDSVWKDVNRSLSKFADEMLGRDRKPREFVPRSGRDCDECNSAHALGYLWTCPGNGAGLCLDLSDWSYELVMSRNNCYSYARRARWCSPGSGSQPGNQNSSTLAETKAALRADRLIEVCRHDVLSSRGDDFIALLNIRDDDEPYHFLRLDGDYWTHFFAGYPAVAWDEWRQPIPKAAVEDAKFKEYNLKAYYNVPRRRLLRHCQ